MSYFYQCINFIQLAVALGTHILGFILAIIGIFFAAAFWSVLSATCISTHTTNRGFTVKDNDFCSCKVKDKTFVCKSFIMILINLLNSYRNVEAS